MIDKSFSGVVLRFDAYQKKRREWPIMTAMAVISIVTGLAIAIYVAG